eukprot:9470815-Pyramimonas_sp.AAC.1
MSSLGAGVDSCAPGTPVQQLFKQHRIHSPLQDMDGLDDAESTLARQQRFQAQLAGAGGSSSDDKKIMGESVS